jgi:hypothetical protein
LLRPPPRGRTVTACSFPHARGQTGPTPPTGPVALSARRARIGSGSRPALLRSGGGPSPTLPVCGSATRLVRCTVGCVERLLCRLLRRTASICVTPCVCVSSTRPPGRVDGGRRAVGACTAAVTA